MTVKNGLYVNDKGTRLWFKDNKLHRENGPAAEWPNGTRRWYKDGKLHRDCGPAVEYTDGNRHWYKNGELHRDDGPAVEWANGGLWWCYHSIEYSFEKWCELTNQTPEAITLLRLKYGCR